MGFSFLIFIYRVFLLFLHSRKVLTLPASQKQTANDLQLSSESAWFWKPWNLLGKAEEGFPETRENCFLSESKQE
jgi:hypothetical protein